MLPPIECQQEFSALPAGSSSLLANGSTVTRTLLSISW